MFVDGRLSHADVLAWPWPCPGQARAPAPWMGRTVRMDSRPTPIPEHQPGKDHPAYELFLQAKGRLKRQGLWRCAVNNEDCRGPAELHHTRVEYADTDLDLAKVAGDLGLDLDDDD